MDKYEIEEIAIKEYVSSNESMSNIAKKYGYSGGWLLKNMSKRGIDRRGRSEWKLRKDDEKDACKDYQKGMLVKDISNKYKISRKTLTEWLKRNGITPLKFNQRLGITDEMKHRALDMYSKENLNCVEISKILGCSSRSVLDWVKDIKKTKSEISCIMSLKGKKKNYGKKGFVNTKFGVIRFDSSYERDRINQICENSEVVSLSRCPYLIKYDTRNYKPDFLVKYKNGEVFIEEVKPIFMLNDSVNVMKFEKANIFCNQNNMFFKIITENEIYGNK